MEILLKNKNNIEVSFMLHAILNVVKETLSVSVEISELLNNAQNLEEVAVSESIEYILDDLTDEDEFVKMYESISDEEKDIVAKVILYCIAYSENVIKYDAILDSVSEVVEVVEDSLNIIITDELQEDIYNLVRTSIPKKRDYNPTIKFSNLSFNVIKAFGALSVAVKELNPSINQDVLNTFLECRLDLITDEVDVYSDTDEAVDRYAKRRRTVRNGKLITTSRRKKRMSSSQRKKISRSLKKSKAKRKVKPSTIRKMLKSREKGARRGLYD